MRNIYFILLLAAGFYLFLPATVLAAPIQKDTTAVYRDSLRNAYELAKELQHLKTDTGKLSPADEKRYQLLFGRVLWYANLQDSTGDITALLSARLKSFYPGLYQKVMDIYSKLNPTEPYFTGRITDLQFSKLDVSVRAKLETGYDIRVSLEHKLDANKKRRHNLFDTTAILQTIAKDTAGKSADTILMALGKVADTVMLRSVGAAVSYNKTIVNNLENEFGELVYSLDSLNAAMQEIFTREGIGNGVGVFLRSINGRKDDLEPFTTASDITRESIAAAEAHQSIQVNYQTQILGPQGGAASFRMPSEAEMIDAVAIYLAKRMKQESVMWFFETISRNAARYELMNVFFPATLKLLKGNENYEIPNMGAQWKYALSEDFVRLPRNVMKSDWLKKRWPGGTQYVSYLNGACDIADMLLEDKAYPEIIRNLYLNSRRNAARDTTIIFDDYITLLYAVNSELFTVSADSSHTMRLLRYEDYRNMNKAEIEMMLSLVDLKYGKVCSRFLNLSDTMRLNATVNAEEIRLLLGRIEHTVAGVETVRRTFTEELKKDKEKGQVQEMAYTTFSVWNAANSLLSIFDSTVNPSPVFSKGVTRSKEAFRYTSQVFEVYNLIAKKNYAGAVQQTIGMLDKMFYGQGTDSMFTINIKHVDSLYRIYDSSTLLRYIVEYQKADADMEKRFGFKLQDTLLRFSKTSPMAAILFEKDRHAAQVIRKLAGFLNDAALAKDAGELSRAVESYALPPGSYKRKRNSWWSADINAFVGPYLGREWVADNQDVAGTKGVVYGFSAPIGISLSKTIGRRVAPGRALTSEELLNPNKLKLQLRRMYYRTKSTFTLTLSIVDIGAVVSYRLGNSDSSLPQEVKWEQFISPGLHFGYGIGGTPLVVQAGFQYTPLLRRLEAADGTSSQYNAYRLYFGVFYDLPLINMWEKKRIAYRKRK